MTPAEFVHVEELGPARLAPIGRRMLMPEFGLRVFEEMQAEEEAFFGGGKYVQSGALRASLVESHAPGAVRMMEPGGLKFGSSVSYAKYQGTRGVGRHKLPSAILRAKPAEAAMAARSLRDYVLEGRRV